MGASVTLVTPAVAVEPGQSVSVTVKVRNTGSVVDEFALDVLGDAAAWAAVEPPTVNLFPGAEAEAKAVFRPPRAAATPSGLIPFGLRARSREDPAGSAVEEGSVTVGGFMDPHAELVPRTSRGSGSGSHDVAVDNRGNTRLSAEIEATDADQQLKFDVKPPAVVVEPGMAGFAKVKVMPAKKFWRGQPKTRPFQLFIKPEGGLPITLDGTLLQESVLPPWFLKALLLALLAIVALVIFWLFLLKPSIQTAASEAVASPLASLKEEVNEALDNAGLATIPADGGASEAPATPAPPTPSLAPGVTPPPSVPPTPTPDPGVTIPGLGAPIDGSLSKAAPTANFTGTLFLTDFLFSNPNAQEGAIVVLRNDVPLMRLRLENFRDYDVHFVTPIVIAEGESLNLSLVCEAAGECDPAVLYSGYLRP
ncbi:MAG TPA: hypothetical protein VES19_12320 [Candidatus Limnocylindrales bacterium]|nr:hypothetical protein [Candidatus Limnocylindrales bacterium]